MASISDPFLLHSYALPSSRASSSRLPHVQASASSHGEATEVILTVQGDGLHILDLANLHPVASHTLGPSTFFSAPAISRVAKDGKRRTVVGVASAPDMQGGGNTVWMWPEGSEENSTRISVELAHPASQLLHPPSLPSRLVVISPNGTTTLTSSDLTTVATLPYCSPTVSWCKSFAFSRQNCSFAPPQRSSGEEAVLVQFWGTEEGGFGVRLIRVDEGNLEEVGWVPLEGVQTADVMSISCEATGHVGILARPNKLHSYRISINPALSCPVLSSPFDLPLPPSNSSGPDLSPASLLALTSSHVLLAYTSPSPRQLTLEIWDLRYSVLLSSRSANAPASLPEHFGVQLVHGANGQALAVLSPGTGSKSTSDGKARSSVLVVPYTTPRESTLLNALGRVVGSSTATAADRPSTDRDPAEDERERLLASIEQAFRRGTPEEAEAAFLAWVGGKGGAPHTNGFAGSGSESGEDSEKDAAQPAKPNGKLQGKDKGKAKAKELPYTFVSRLLNLLVAPTKPAYPAQSNILRYLLSRRVVSYGMTVADDGLLGVLLARGDWPCIYGAMRQILDIPEAAVIKVLVAILNATRTASAEDAMAVDLPANTPPLPALLAAVVSAPTSPPALRAALKEQLSDISDVTRLLNILQDWTTVSIQRGWELDKNEAPKVRLNKSKAKERDYSYYVPKIDQTLSFLQALLDTYFISLLQHPPAHQILRRLAELLSPQLALAAQLERLRGPLEPFAKEKRREKAPKDPTKREDWRQRRRRAREADELRVGLYQVEEFVL